MSEDRYYANEIEITDEHRKLAARAFVRFDGDMEWGIPGLDAKRPFGNSDMPDDVAEILGWEWDEDEGLTDAQRERAIRLHFEMGYVIKSLLRMFADSGMGES